MKKISVLLYGVVAYACFLATFVYAIGFVGDVFVPKNIDSGDAPSLALAVLVDALLLSVFAVQHSVMARQGFKRQWTKFVPLHIERSSYVVAAAAALALLFWQWQPIPQVVWSVNGVWAEILRGLFGLGFGTVWVSTCLVNHFELFGLQQAWGYFRGREFQGPAFKTPGLYRWIRHPLYAGFLVGFWAAPVMTVGHLLFSIATTGYILLGIYFEERDLIASFGQSYRVYQHRVPMLIPFSKRSENVAKPTRRSTAEI